MPHRASLGILCICVSLILLEVGCGGSGSKGKVGKKPPPKPKGPDKELIEKHRASIEAFCGACHAMPSPKRFPRLAWNAEVDQGYEFYYKSKRKDLPKPPKKSIVRTWFASQADDHLKFEKIASTPSQLQFKKTQIVVSNARPVVANVAWLRRDDGPGNALYLSDMATGDHVQLVFTAGRHKIGHRASVGHPCHTHVTDLFEKGKFGCVVADLGSVLPADHADGRVLWVVPGKFRQQVHVLAKGIGRVADVRSADFDGDGDKDLIAAVFGWRATGKTILLRRKNDRSLPPEKAFDVEEVDPRHGGIHVPLADINGDGKMDFVALLGQEHESIEAFINDGKGKFDPQVIYRANSPSFGSSGIQLVDINGDKKVDVLYTNGDTYDSFHLKPYHGIRWIENRGKGEWEERFITPMPGVHRALAGDLDGDGDMDIVACALVPSKMLVDESQELDSVIWLEQTKDGQFKRHVLERNKPRHPTMDMADMDGDGDLDLAIGYQAGQGDSTQTSVTIWWNQRIRKKTD